MLHVRSWFLPCLAILGLALCPAMPSPAWADESPEDESEKRLSLTLADVGLDLAVEKIARHFGANVVIASDLESAGIKVHLHVVDASLEQALQAVATMVGARLDAHEGVWTLSRQRRGEVLQFVDVRDIGTGDAVDDIVAHLQAALPEATIKRQGEGGLIIVRITKEENPTFLRVLHDLRQEAHRARVTREEQENEDASVALDSDEVVIDVRGLGWEQGHNLDRVRRAFPGAELSWVAEGRILRVGGTPDAIREILNHLAKARKEHQANRIRRIDERALRQLREEADANTARQDRMESAVAHIRELETRLAEMSRQQSDLTNVLQLLQARKQTRAAQEIQRDLEKLSVAVTETKSDLAAAREDLATARAELEASRSQIRLDRRDRIRVGDEWTPVRDPRSARGSGPDGAPSRKALEALHAEIRALRAEVQDLRKLVEEALQGR